MRVFISIILLLETFTVSFAQTIDQSQTTLSHFRYDGGLDYQQTFVPSSDGSMSQVDVYVYNGCWGAYSMNVEIYEGSGIGGTLLGTDSHSGGNCAQGWRSFSYTPFTVTGGNTYTIRMAGTSGHMAPQVGSGNPYTAGSFINGPSSTEDIAFRTYMTATLPVELLTFKAVAKEANSILSWSTSQELNNSHFELLSSENGTDYQSVGLIKGNGTSTIVHHYEFLDTHQYQSQSVLYRLKQVDFNGDSTLSKVISCTQKNLFFTSTYTILHTKTSINIQQHGDDSQPFMIQLFSAQGQPILSQKVSLVQQWSLNNLPKGMLFLHLYDENQVIKKKIYIP